MLWLQALVGALMVGGSLGRTLSDVTALDKTSSPVKYHITGVRDKHGHWTEEVQMEHEDQDWHVEVDHTNLEDEQGQPKFKITATFSVKPRETPGVKGVAAPEKDKRWIFKLYPKSHHDWLGAENTCKQWGGHLAVPDSREKLDELTSILYRHIRETGDNYDAFLGFNDIEEEGNFVTVIGKPLFGSQVSWSPPWFRSDQPDDNKSSSPGGEDCGSLRPSGGLNDIPCRNILPFICEKEVDEQEISAPKKAVDEQETNSPATTGEEDEDSLRLFLEYGKNWFEARRACIEWGGHLAIPDSEEKMKKIMQILISRTKNPNLSAAFLGFDDIRNEGEFVTIFGKPVFNSNGKWSPHWYTPAQPDNSLDWSSEGEDCGSLRPNGGLNDVPCRYHLPYVCEKSSEVDNLHDIEADEKMLQTHVARRGSSRWRSSGLHGWHDDDYSYDNDEEEDDHTLRLFTRRDLDWFDANDACKVWGGSLAVPDTKEKVEAMSLKLKSANIEAAFLGFGDQEEEGNFVTIFGAPVFNPSSWSPSWFTSDQPDDDKHWSKDGEDCGSIRSGGGLNDVPCKYHIPYFCEKSLPVQEARDQDSAQTIDTTTLPTSEVNSEDPENDETFFAEGEALQTATPSTSTPDDDPIVPERNDASFSKEEDMNIKVATLTKTVDYDSNLLGSEDLSSNKEEIAHIDHLTQPRTTNEYDLEEEDYGSTSVKEDVSQTDPGTLTTQDDVSNEDAHVVSMLTLQLNDDGSSDYSSNNEIPSVHKYKH